MKTLQTHHFIPVSILFLILFLTALACKSQSRLLALSKSDHTLAIIDPSNLEILARVPVGQDPHEVIASSDGKTAYVSIYGGGSLHELNIIDLVAMKPLNTIDTRPLFGPHGLTFVDGKVWFTAEGSKAVGCFDPQTQKVNWCMGTGQDRTHMIYVTAGADNIYTTNVASGTISILSKTKTGNRENWDQTIIPTSTGTEGFDVSPDGTESWAAASDNGKIYIIDPDAKKIKKTLDAKIVGANRLQFTPDGKRVLISSLRSGALSIYDADTYKEITKINIGHGAAGIMVDPDGSRAFVACSPDNYIAVVDLKTYKVTSHIDVGKNPDGLAWAVQQ
jgi:YVTN family beta-propeller protein